MSSFRRGNSSFFLEGNSSPFFFPSLLPIQPGLVGSRSFSIDISTFRGFLKALSRFLRTCRFKPSLMAISSMRLSSRLLLDRRFFFCFLESCWFNGVGWGWTESGSNRPLSGSSPWIPPQISSPSISVTYSSSTTFFLVRSRASAATNGAAGAISFSDENLRPVRVVRADQIRGIISALDNNYLTREVAFFF